MSFMLTGVFPAEVCVGNKNVSGPWQLRALYATLWTNDAEHFQQCQSQFTESSCVGSWWLMVTSDCFRINWVFSHSMNLFFCLRCFFFFFHSSYMFLTEWILWDGLGIVMVTSDSLITKWLLVTWNVLTHPLSENLSCRWCYVCLYSVETASWFSFRRKVYMK